MLGVGGTGEIPYVGYLISIAYILREFHNQILNDWLDFVFKLADNDSLREYTSSLGHPMRMEIATKSRLWLLSRDIFEPI